MDLQVVGRHALLFDDDATADFVNSSRALVEWYSLQIDRYDVRHLLSAPPPPRRRNRNSEHIVPEDTALESQLDHERYLDLPSHSDQPEVEECEKSSNCGGYYAVGYSYGENDYSAGPKKADTEMDFSGFIPPFAVPPNLLQSLPPTEKVHQIIARTAMFASKHGGQSEIILRVKQGDNPTFGFLMPDHHLHSYFRFLVEHPELLHSEHNEKSQGETKDVHGEHHNTNGVGGALSLLGSAYGSGEEEDSDCNANTEYELSQDNSNSVNSLVSHGSKKVESNADVAKDVLISRNTTPSIKEKVFSVKKNSSISASKSGNLEGPKKNGKSGSFSATAEKTGSSSLGIPSKIEPIILEPPPELKGLIDKIVEFVTRNGRQFEATLIEQDTKHGRFPFLLPSNQYNSYYLKVLQSAQESKTSGRSSSGKDGLVGRGDRKTFVHKKNEFSSLDSDVGDIPLESDIKEKFKMVIGKPKKDVQESRSKGTEQECGVAIDAAAAAAILQAAIKGVNKSNLRISNAPLNAQSDINHSEGNWSTSPISLYSSQTENADRNGSHQVSTLAPKTTLRTCLEASRDQEAQLTEEQKVKAERLKRAKMFVAMLKTGAVPLKNQASRESSADPLEFGASKSANEINLTGKDGGGISAPTDVKRTATVENLERIYFGEEHSERLARRRYRARSGGCDNTDEEEDGDYGEKKRHNKGCSRSKYRSRSRRHEDGNAEEIDGKHSRRRCRSHSSYDENNDGARNEEDGDHACSKPKHHSRHSQNEDDGHVVTYKKVKDHKQSRKKHHSHHSSRKRRCSSKKRSDEENESDSDGRDHQHSQKKHRSQHSSGHGRDKHRHRNGHSSGDKKSRHYLKHDSSSDDEDHNHTSLDKNEKEINDERDELEEGEVCFKVSEGSSGIASGHVSRETSVGALISHERATSQPPGTTSEVPDDLRAKIRAMLMATRL
ncbi:uncharacterized protein LOC142526409 isoform X1 [Primulina tabacum]|uniref:uncharacterized protein LOC142526409 isoform X1 n=3 Tax=Primulina tabacum TaxID=48773 RepID=UPI003F59B689